MAYPATPARADSYTPPVCSEEQYKSSFEDSRIKLIDLATYFVPTVSSDATSQVGMQCRTIDGHYLWETTTNFGKRYIEYNSPMPDPTPKDAQSVLITDVYSQPQNSIFYKIIGFISSEVIQDGYSIRLPNSYSGAPAAIYLPVTNFQQDSLGSSTDGWIKTVPNATYTQYYASTYTDSDIFIQPSPNGGEFAY